MAVTALYLEVVRALDARRRALGWSMAELDDRAGTNDGYFAKALHADTPSGRQAGWEILDLFSQALFPAGTRVAIAPAFRGLKLPAPANQNGPAEQLPLDLDIAGPYCSLRSWYRRRRPPRVYRAGGGRRRA
ncbi:hypothetical protein [Azospirillum himalayense]|uniref:XRE family transcriptional regulator n=1 Tax=Azospirillum himalayense TaxID=654847 RepID=A0ABW0G730_9PROT